MKKFAKKLMALTMAAVMMCAPLTALAAGDVTDEESAYGGSEGSGQLAGYVDTDVFCVVLPTEATDNTTYNFTMDPQHLLNKTGQEGYNASDTVFFASTGSTYSGTSDTLTAQNKGTVQVDVSVTATASDLAIDDVSIPLTADKTFADDKTASLYLGLIMGTSPAVPLDATSLSATAMSTMNAVDEDSYEFKKVGDEFEFVLKDTVTTFPEASFKLEGACNSNGDKAAWLAVKNAGITPRISVTWTLQKHGPRVSITKAGKITVSGIPAGVSVDLTKSSYHGSAAPTPYLISTYCSTDASGYTAENGGTIIYQMPEGTVTYYAGQDMIVDITLSDGTVLSATTKITPKVSVTPSGKITVANIPAGVSVDLTQSSYHGTTDSTPYLISTYCSTDDSGYTAEAGGTIIYQMPEATVTYFKGQAVTVTITFSDGTTLTAKTSM